MCKIRYTTENPKIIISIIERHLPLKAIQYTTMINTRGYTYFAIKTQNDNFDLETFNNYLSIQPTRFQKKFERGKVPITTSWQLSSGDLTNPDYFKEIEKLITKLNKHKTEFLKLKNENPEIEFVLEVVIHLGDEHPGLNFSQETIAFINDIGGTIDCDIYNEK